jgi:hypothetical protein
MLLSAVIAKQDGQKGIELGLLPEVGDLNQMWFR